MKVKLDALVIEQQKEETSTNKDDKIKILRSWSIMFGLVELELRLDGEEVTLILFFIFYLVWFILGCIMKIGVVTCREVP